MKRFFAVVFAVMFTVSVKLISAYATTPYYYGDVNKSGMVDSADARSVLRDAVGIELLENNSNTPTAAQLADIDKDGKITPADARTTLRIAVGLDVQKEFPVSVDIPETTEIDKEILVEPVKFDSFVALAKAELGNDGVKYQQFTGYAGAWCASFISWTLRQAADQELVKDNLVPLSSSTTAIANFYKEKGLWKDNDGSYIPKEGDLFFMWDYSDVATNTDAVPIPRSYYHLGIVTGFSNGYIQTVEGNTSDVNAENGERNYKVRTVQRSLSNGTVAGFAVLDLTDGTPQDALPDTGAAVLQEGSNQTKSIGTSLGTFVCSAYCGCKICSGDYGNMTATGVIAQPNHTIAVDPIVIPYGTKVVIDGITYTAEDCGGTIKGNKIDVYFESHQEALNFGLKSFEVFLLEE